MAARKCDDFTAGAAFIRIWFEFRILVVSSLPRVVGKRRSASAVPLISKFIFVFDRFFVEPSPAL
jgi:hypothetical protein